MAVFEEKSKCMKFSEAKTGEAVVYLELIICGVDRLQNLNEFFVSLDARAVGGFVGLDFSI